MEKFVIRLLSSYRYNIKRINVWLGKLLLKLSMSKSFVNYWVIKQFHVTFLINIPGFNCMLLMISLTKHRELKKRNLTSKSNYIQDRYIVKISEWFIWYQNFSKLKQNLWNWKSIQMPERFLRKTNMTASWNLLLLLTYQISFLYLLIILGLQITHSYW